MAKAVRTARGSQPPRRPPRPAPGMATAGADRRQSLVEYLRGVAEELRKVVWPARHELWRMTGIVIATVLIFGALIGGADYLLSLGVRQVYTTQNSTTPTAAATAAPTAVPTAAPTARATPLP